MRRMGLARSMVPVSVTGLFWAMMAELGLRRGAGLHLCREAAEEQPGGGQRPEGDAGFPTRGCGGE